MLWEHRGTMWTMVFRNVSQSRESSQGTIAVLFPNDEGLNQGNSFGEWREEDGIKQYIMNSGLVSAIN